MQAGVGAVGCSDVAHLLAQVFVSCEERGVLLERVRHRYLEFRRRFDQLFTEFKEHCVSLEHDVQAAEVQLHAQALRLC